MRVPESLLFFGYFLKGAPIGAKLNFLRKSQFYDRQTMEELKLRKLKNLLEFSLTHNAYYKELFLLHGIQLNDIKSLSDLHKIPILNKNIIKENFPHHLVSREVPVKRIINHETGGSTGSPMKFAYDKQSVSWATAALYRALEWYGARVGDKIAYLVGANQISFLDRLRFRLGDKVVLNAFKVDDRQLQRYFDFIRRNQIQVLYGYPSALYLFALFLLDRKLSFDWKLILLSTGETLKSEYREAIEKAFNSNVFDQYGCREINMIATQTPDASALRVIDEHVIVEIDQNGETLGPGEYGNIVVTDLDNYAMPFIRYETGDVGRHLEISSDFNRMDHVDGRIFDILRDTKGKMVAPNVLNSIMWGRLDDLGEYKSLGIKQYQVIQHSLHAIDLNIVVEKTPTKKAEEMLAGNFRSVLGEGVEVKVNWVSEVSTTKGGKRHLIISKIRQ